MTRRPDWWKTHFDAASLSGYGLPAKTRREVAGAARLLALRRPADILDLACGAGRHALGLAALGHRVTGVDWSESLLEAGRRAAAEAGIPVAFSRADMRALRCRRRFDAVVNLFTSFGYFETDAEDLAVLRGVRRALRPGGAFLIDTLNKSWLLRHFSPSFWTREPEGEVLKSFSRLSFDPATSRLATRRTLYLRGGRRRETHLDFKVYDLSEMTRLLEASGLAVDGAFGAFDGRPYGLDTFRLIVRAVRPRAGATRR